MASFFTFPIAALALSCNIIFKNCIFITVLESYLTVIVAFDWN